MNVHQQQLDAQLLRACNTGDAANARALLSMGSRFGPSLPIMAAGKFSCSILTVLLQQTDVEIHWNKSFSFGGTEFTALSMAVRMGMQQNVKLLLTHSKVCVFSENTNVINPLHMLILVGNSDMALEFVNYFVQKQYMHGLAMLLHLACAETCSMELFKTIVATTSQYVPINVPWLSMYNAVLHTMPHTVYMHPMFTPLQTFCANVRVNHTLQSVMSTIGTLVAHGATLRTRSYLPAALLAFRRHPTTTRASRIVHHMSSNSGTTLSIAQVFAATQRYQVKQMLCNARFNPETAFTQQGLQDYFRFRAAYVQLVPAAGLYDAPTALRQCLQLGWCPATHWSYPRWQRNRIRMFVLSNVVSFRTYKSISLPVELMECVLKWWRR